MSMENLSQELSFAMDAVSSDWARDDGRLYTQRGRAFLGISPRNLSRFAKGEKQKIERFLNNEQVLRTIGRYRDLDVDGAREISIALGDIASSYNRAPTELVEFAINMLRLGGRRSGESVAKAIVPYVMSRGSLEATDELKRDVYFMSDVIEEDETPLIRTEDLGVSQALRLRMFLQKISGKSSGRYTPDFLGDMEALDGFPTIGAEFHIAPQTNPDNNLLRRLVVFNMSQYQRGSFVPFSRTDQGVTEVRMNPSFYPVTIANWNLMQRIFPELADQYLTVCMGADKDFVQNETGIIPLLQTLGSIVYASVFGNVPYYKINGGLDFGKYYLGQTVRLKDGKYLLEGGRHTGTGQLNLYAGFGDTFPHQIYYLSMAYAEHELLGVVEREAGRGMLPSAAVAMNERDRRHILQTITDKIAQHPRLRRATEYGQRIIEELWLDGR